MTFDFLIDQLHQPTKAKCRRTSIDLKKFLFGNIKHYFFWICILDTPTASISKDLFLIFHMKRSNQVDVIGCILYNNIIRNNHKNIIRIVKTILILSNNAPSTQAEHRLRIIKIYHVVIAMTQYSRYLKLLLLHATSVHEDYCFQIRNRLRREVQLLVAEISYSRHRRYRNREVINLRRLALMLQWLPIETIND